MTTMGKHSNGSFNYAVLLHLMKGDILTDPVAKNGSWDTIAGSNVSSYDGDFWEVGNADPKKHMFKVVLEALNVYLTPFIIFLGVFGHTTSLVVFTQTYLRMQPSSVYLAALSVADIGFLLSLLVVWLARVNIRLFHMAGVCQTIVYLMYVFTFLSAWNVVGFTVERYIAVHHSFWRDCLCSHRRAKMAVITFVCIALPCYAFVFWTSGVVDFGDRGVCMPMPQHYDIMTFITGIDLAIVFIIPSIIIVSLNVKIMVKLQLYQKLKCHSRTEVQALNNNAEFGCHSNGTANGDICQHGTPATPKRRSLIQTSVSRSGSVHFTFNSRISEIMTSSPFNQAIKSMKKNRSQHRTSRMLLFISSVFVVLNSPSHIFRLRAFIQGFMAEEQKNSRNHVQWQELFELVFFLNFAVNFFVYSASSSLFRKALCRLWCRYFRIKHKKDSKAEIVELQ